MRYYLFRYFAAGFAERRRRILALAAAALALNTACLGAFGR